MGSQVSEPAARRGTGCGGDGPNGQTPLPLEAPNRPPVGQELEALIEALLLVAPEPATPGDLAHGAGVSIAEVEAVLAAMEGDQGRGWVVQRHRGAVQLATAPRFAAEVRRFLGLEREARLSAAALETLAIIAYQQPVTRAEVEAVRGVDCAGVLSTLHGRGLIEAVGRLETVGRPIQYGTTPEFLRHFGLRSLAELPPLGEVEGRDARVLLESAVAAAEMADGGDRSADGDNGSEDASGRGASKARSRPHPQPDPT